MRVERGETMRRGGWILAIGLGLTIGASGSRAGEPTPEAATLRDHVATLCSDEFAGRRGEGARKAADYLVAHFRNYGLEPLFDGQYEQPILGETPDKVIGRNVGAVLRGSDPALRDEWIIVSAHYDHLGTRGEVTYRGADDNASGVAMLLELARSFSEQPTPPRRSLMFIGFDLEENGLWGSRFFADHPPIPLEKVKLFLTADMIARALGGVVDPYVFIMGSEHATGLRPLLDRAGADLPLKLGVVGSDLLLFDRSDYGPFRARKIPYLFFSTGENPKYHTPRDTPDSLNYPKFTAIVRLIFRVVVDAADVDRLPAWTEADHSFREVAVIHDVLRTLLAHKDDLKIKPLQESYIEREARTLEDVMERGKITAAERRRMLLGAQFILYSVL